MQLKVFVKILTRLKETKVQIEKYLRKKNIDVVRLYIRINFKKERKGIESFD